MTTPRPSRPDARLLQLHAERGHPLQRLSSALTDLEGCDWGIFLANEAALAQQLSSVIGSGTLRVDGRISLDRSAFAEAGLAVTHLYGDLSGARAIWLFQPDLELIERAKKAGIPVILDTTLAPMQYPDLGTFHVYRNGHTLSGHDTSVAVLFGRGKSVPIVAPSPSDLTLSLLLRDIATLPLRLARAAQTVNALRERLGAAVSEAGPTVLFLPAGTASQTSSPLGGLLAAVQPVPEGLLLTPGIESIERSLELMNQPSEPIKPKAPEKTPVYVAKPPKRPIVAETLAVPDKPDIPAPTTERMVFEKPEAPKPTPKEEVPPVIPEPTEVNEPKLIPDLPSADESLPDLTPEQKAIFTRLRDWRNTEAKQREVSRFIVASNATLNEIARRVPYTLDDLAEIKGMGKARIQKYGEIFLKLVRGSS